MQPVHAEKEQPRDCARIIRSQVSFLSICFEMLSESKKEIYVSKNTSVMRLQDQLSCVTRKQVFRWPV